MSWWLLNSTGFLVMALDKWECEKLASLRFSVFKELFLRAESQCMCVFSWAYLYISLYMYVGKHSESLIFFFFFLFILMCKNWLLTV